MVFNDHTRIHANFRSNVIHLDEEEEVVGDEAHVFKFVFQCFASILR